MQGSTRPAKVSAVNLPQEYNLVKVIEKITNPDPTWSLDTPSCEWRDVECDEQKEIVAIYWSHAQLCGQLQFKHVPTSVLSFNAEGNKLTGDVHLVTLPSKLERINLSHNTHTGSLDLSLLPTSLESADFGWNQFSGGICLSQLPANLQRMDLQHNTFSGKLRLHNLPLALQRLILNDNQFEGNVDLHSLPPDLWALRLRNNPELCSDVCLRKLPFELKDWIVCYGADWGNTQIKISK